MSDEKPINPDQLRINVEFMRKEVAEGKMSEKTLTDIQKALREEPADVSREIDKMAKSVMLAPSAFTTRTFSSDDHNLGEMNVPSEVREQRHHLWYSAQVAISKLNAPNGVKNELLETFMPAQVKVYEGTGGFSGQAGRYSRDQVEDGLVDLKLFARQLQRAEDKYGLMTPEAHKQWVDKKPDGKTSAVDKRSSLEAVAAAARTAVSDYTGGTVLSKPVPTDTQTRKV